MPPSSDSDEEADFRRSVVMLTGILFPGRVQLVLEHGTDRCAWTTVEESIWCATHAEVLLPSYEETPPAERERAELGARMLARAAGVVDDVSVVIIQVAGDNRKDPP